MDITYIHIEKSKNLLRAMISKKSGDKKSLS